MTGKEDRSARRRGRPVEPKAETPEAEELARWLYRLTGHLSIRDLAERFEYNKTKWARLRNGTDLIPSWLLEKVVRDLVREPVRQKRDLARGLELLARAEAAAAGKPTAAMLALPQPELQVKLEEARRGQEEARRTLVGMTQMTVLLLGFVASLSARCHELEEQNASAAQHRGYLERLTRAEGQLDEARHGREEAEALRLEAHLQAERYRRALGGPLEASTVSGSVSDPQPLPMDEQECDRLLQANALHLQQARHALDDLRSRLGLPPRDDAASRIVRGQLADKEAADDERADSGTSQPRPAGPVRTTHRFGYQVSPQRAKDISRSLYAELNKTDPGRRYRLYQKVMIVVPIAAVTVPTAMIADIVPGSAGAIVLYLVGLGIAALATLIYLTLGTRQTMERDMAVSEWALWPCWIDRHRDQSGWTEMTVTLLDPDGRSTRSYDSWFSETHADRACFPPGPSLLWIAASPRNATCVIAFPSPASSRQAVLGLAGEPSAGPTAAQLGGHELHPLVEQARSAPDTWPVPTR